VLGAMKGVRAPAPRHEEFVFRVRRPSVSYHFSLQDDRRVDDPYDEMLSITFIAECLYPNRCKGRETEARFHADSRLTAGSKQRERKPEDPIKAVGSIRIGKARFEVGGFLPPDICWRLGAAMAAGSVTAMLANGHWPTRGHGYLNSIAFYGPEFDPATYIG
jgi:hypothetical protein